MNNLCKSKIPAIAEVLLSELEKRVSSSSEKQFSDDELLSLHSVFGVVLQRALDILEKYNTLVLYTNITKRRSLIEIKGEKDRCYRVIPRINFCPCRAFKHQVLERKVQIYCKHVLAARLAQILGKIEEQTVTQEQYLMLLKSMYELEEHNG